MEQGANFRVTKNAVLHRHSILSEPQTAPQAELQTLARVLRNLASPTKCTTQSQKHHLCSLSPQTRPVSPDIWIRDPRVEQARAVRQLSDVSFIGNISDPLLDADALSRAGFLLKDGARTRQRQGHAHPTLNQSSSLKKKEEGVLFFEGFGICVL